LAGYLVRSLISLTGAQIFSRILSFITVTYLARILTSEGFGMISFSLALLSFFSLISDLGLKTFGSRSIAQNRQGVVDIVMSLRLVFVPLSFVLLIFVANLLDTSRTQKMVIVLYGLSLFFELFFVEWLFFGFQQLKSISIARTVRMLTYSILVFSFVKSKSDVLLVPIFYGIGLLFAAIYMMSRYRQIPEIRFSFNLTNWQSSLYQAVPMGFAYIMTQIYYNFDSIMLGLYKSSKVVGLYNSGYKIVFFLVTFFLVYHQTLLPILSRHYQKEKTKFDKTINHAVKYVIYFSLPISLGGTILANGIILQVFGKTYLPCVLAFRILLWTFFVNNVAALFGNALMACNAQIKYMIGVTIGAVFNIFLNIVLIPKYSLVGAAGATLLSQFIVFLYMYFNSRRFHSLVLPEFARLLSKPIVSSGVMALSLYVFRDINLNPLVIVGGLTYLVVLFLLKGISTEELQTFKNWVMVKG